jgi:hypothetical protein
MKTGTKAQRHEGTKGKIDILWHFPACLRAFVPLCLLLSSCTYNHAGDDPATFHEKEDQALSDPIHYQPDNENTQPYNISGGGINNLDTKALKKDLDNVLDP